FQNIARVVEDELPSAPTIWPLALIPARYASRGMNDSVCTPPELVQENGTPPKPPVVSVRPMTWPASLMPVATLLGNGELLISFCIPVPLVQIKLPWPEDSYEPPTTPPPLLMP